MSAAVGIGFLVVGLLLLLAAATYGGGAAVGFFGVLLLLFGVFAVAISDDIRADVGVGLTSDGSRSSSAPSAWRHRSSTPARSVVARCDRTAMSRRRPLLNDATERRDRRGHLNTTGTGRPGQTEA